MRDSPWMDSFDDRTGCCMSAASSAFNITCVALKARLDGASFRAPAYATLHSLMHASWRKSRASLAACFLLFGHYGEARECL